jgi:hypothetical protein
VPLVVRRADEILGTVGVGALIPMSNRDLRTVSVWEAMRPVGAGVPAGA